MSFRGLPGIAKRTLLRIIDPNRARMFISTKTYWEIEKAFEDFESVAGQVLHSGHDIEELEQEKRIILTIMRHAQNQNEMGINPHLNQLIAKAKASCDNIIRRIQAKQIEDSQIKTRHEGQIPDGIPRTHSIKDLLEYIPRVIDSILSDLANYANVKPRAVRKRERIAEAKLQAAARVH